MSDFQIRRRRAFLFDRIQKIRPQLFQVIPVDSVAELRFFVNYRLLVVAGIEGPTVSPSHVKNAFGTVKIRSDAMFFRTVSRIVPVFPDRRERIETINGGLRIGRVGSGCLLSIHRGPGNEPSAGRIYRSRIFFLCPPQHLIQPMHPPVAERTVGVIEKITPTAGGDLGIEGPLRRRAAPEIPIHAVGDVGIGRRPFAASVPADHE